MYKGKKILGIIPARGGSKGLPGKNIRPLAGIPLIGWTIRAGKASRYFDRIVVSTDSPEIAKIAQGLGGDVPCLRPATLARDSSTSFDVIVHVLKVLENKGEEYEYVALLEPTSPLRAPGDLDLAVKKLIDNSGWADSLVSVGQVHTEHPTIVKRIQKGFVTPYVRSKKVVKRRQDCDAAYFPYGAIYLSKTKVLLKTGTFYQKRTIPYEIERWQNYEVDDQIDFDCIETILKKKLSEERT